MKTVMVDPVWYQDPAIAMVALGAVGLVLVFVWARVL